MSRRWNRWTFVAKRVRKVASSNAVSPPPTTAISRSRKKNPSQVAHAETPRPRSRVSESRPSHSADAPVATMTDCARYRCRAPRCGTGAREKSTRSMSTSTRRVPKRSAWAAERGHQVGALDAVDEARVVLDVAGEHQLAARGGAREHDRLEVGPGGVDRGGQARPGRTRRSRPWRRRGPRRRRRSMGRRAAGIAAASVAASIIEIERPPKGLSSVMPVP